MQRRDFLKVAAGTAVTTLATAKANSVLPDDIDTQPVRDYLRRIMPTRQQVEDFIRREQGPEKLSRNDGWTFDTKLGWVLCDSVRTRGVDGSKGFYSYEPDGARKFVNLPDKISRIHTYGNSFTHCGWVSDGETRQEYLAAHIAEPIHNYGVGGYSVYQAYQCMLEVEKENPAEYIILNIWDDDHFRNLDSWRAIRFGHRTACGYTLPHLRVNFREDRLQQMGNVAADWKGMPRFDHGFVNWLKDKSYPVIDMRDAFRAEYRPFKTDVNTYLGRYYIGHDNPAGNFFAAWAIKNRVVKWLDPSALPYR